jgi:hypothetical protein
MKWLSADFADWRGFSKRRAVMMEVFGRQEPLSLTRIRKLVGLFGGIQALITLIPLIFLDKHDSLFQGMTSKS